MTLLCIFLSPPPLTCIILEHVCLWDYSIFDCADMWAKSFCSRQALRANCQTWEKEKNDGVTQFALAKCCLILANQSAHPKQSLSAKPFWWEWLNAKLREPMLLSWSFAFTMKNTVPLCSASVHPIAFRSNVSLGAQLHPLKRRSIHGTLENCSGLANRWGLPKLCGDTHRQESLPSTIFGEFGRCILLCTRIHSDRHNFDMRYRFVSLHWQLRSQSTEIPPPLWKMLLRYTLICRDTAGFSSNGNWIYHLSLPFLLCFAPSACASKQSIPLYASTLYLLKFYKQTLLLSFKANISGLMKTNLLSKMFPFLISLSGFHSHCTLLYHCSFAYVLIQIFSSKYSASYPLFFSPFLSFIYFFPLP